MDDLHSVLDNADGHELLAIVTTVHHQRIGQPLDNRTLGFAESLHRVSSCSVGNICGVLSRGNSDVVSKRYVADLLQQLKQVRSIKTSRYFMNLKDRAA